ncbi:MAG: hypothetical protein WCG08_04870 [Paludibacter sp.]|jgi:hypothetical protein
MEIVPTSNTKKKKIGLDDLIAHKAELKQQIYNQREQISVSGKKLFSLDTLTTYIFGSIQNSLTLADGVMMGMKLVQTLKKFFTKKK